MKNNCSSLLLSTNNVLSALIILSKFAKITTIVTPNKMIKLSFIVSSNGTKVYNTFFCIV